MRAKVSDLIGKAVVSVTRRRQGSSNGSSHRWTHTIEFHDGSTLVIDSTGYRVRSPQRIKQPLPGAPQP